MFIGYHGQQSIALDSKGRIAIPTKYRERLLADAGGEMVLTRHPDKFLLLYPVSEWVPFYERVMNLPASLDILRTVLVGSAEVVSMDATGRVLISPELREEASLGSSVKFIGVGKHFRICDPERNKAAEELGWEHIKDKVPEDFRF